MKIYGSEQMRFSGFAKELEALSLKYGVFIQSVGGVEIVAQENEADCVPNVRVSYSNDETSGDLVYEYWEA